jgi:hypothetical protein
VPDAGSPAGAAPTQDDPKQALVCLRDALTSDDAKAIEACVADPDPAFRVAFGELLRGGLRAGVIDKTIEERGLRDKLGRGTSLVQIQAGTVDKNKLDEFIANGTTEIAGEQATLSVTTKVSDKHTKKTSMKVTRSDGRWGLTVPEAAKPSTLKLAGLMPAFYDAADEALGKPDDGEAAAAFDLAYTTLQNTLRPPPPPIAAPPYGTPEATFDAAWQAMVRRDRDAFVRCYTPKALDLAAHDYAKRAWLMVHQNPGRPIPDVDKMVESYNLDRALLDKPIKGVDPMRQTGKKLDPMAKKLVKKLKDKRGFVADSWKDSSGSFIAFVDRSRPATLEDLKVKGRRATATAAWWSSSKEKKTTDVTFQRTKNGWLLSAPPAFK